MSLRISKDEYYLKICKDIALRSSCKNRRRFGALIIKNDVIISTGYNGSPRKTINCGEECDCLKNIFNEPSMTSYEYCNAIHAEQNAIINAARNGNSTVDSVMYLAEINGKDDFPCYLCRRMIINAGIKEVVVSINNVIHKVSANKFKEIENSELKEKLLKAHNFKPIK